MEGKESTLEFAGFPVINTTTQSLCDTLARRLHESRQCVLLFANANFIVQCRDYLRWLRQDPVLIVNDGIAMDMAARLLHGERFRENLNGTDFCPAFLSSLSRPHRLFLVGGQPHVAERAARVIRERYGHNVVGCADGFGQLRDPELPARINASGAEIVLVALGNPRQEAWIKEHHSHLDAKLVIGVGALLDFLSGNVRRAPGWIRRIRCEWLYRLALEPKRLLKRYTVDILRFAYLITTVRTPRVQGAS